MSQSTPPPASLRLLENARNAAEAFRAKQALQGGRPLAIGDILVLPDVDDTGDGGIEWVFADRIEDRVLLVPADHAPHNGEGDLRATPTSGGPATAPLWLRPRWARWLPSAVLDGARWSGTLPSIAVNVARARAEQRQADGDRLLPGPGTPGYRAWIERAIMPARQALDAIDRDTDHEPTARTAARPLDELTTLSSPVSTRATWQRFVPLAAVLFLALGGALLVWGLFEHDRADRAEARLAGLELAASVHANAAYAFLHPADSLRGDVPEIVQGEGRSVILLVALLPPDSVPKVVDLVLQRVGEDVPVWTGEATVTADHEARVAIPTDLLPVGRYRLLALANHGGDAAEAGLEYRFVVTAGDGAT